MTKLGFCAVAGNGMSALAQIMKLKGHSIFGSDLSFDQGRDMHRKKALQDVGIEIRHQDGSMIKDGIETLYVSSAIDSKNPDIKAAKENNIPILKRVDLLLDIFHQYTHNIAVGGTSGKSTTTAMIGYVLDVLGLKPCMINGAFLKNYDSQPGLANYIYNQGNICVVEADESDGSIRQYFPYFAIINNITHDHEPIEVLMEYFKEFASHAKQGIILNYDDPNVMKLTHHKKVFTYSIQDRNADIFAYNIQPHPTGVKYSIEGKSFNLQLIGRYNVYNALAAISACMMLGIDKFDAAKALEGFLGVKRRLSVSGTKNNITVYDDFAHNAQKIEASLKALKEFPGRLIVMYQSHKPFSARTTGEEDGVIFGTTLGSEDILLMPEIFMRDPIADSDISAADLIQYAKNNGVANALFLETKEKVKEYILKIAKPGDRIVIMGARDNALPAFSKSILEEL